jgi:hypothetical protein
MMERQKSYLFKQENCPFERTGRKDQGNGFLQPVPGSLYFSEKSNLFVVHLTFHGYDRSFFFQKRETQDEKGSKIGESS